MLHSVPSYSVIIIVLLYVLYIDTCIIYFQVLYQDGDMEVKSSVKREEPERSPGEGTYMCMPHFMTSIF